MKKRVRNCEASGYSTNTALSQRWLGTKNKLSTWDNNGLCKEMYIQTHGRKAYVQWGAVWFPKRIVYDTAITTPLPRSLQHGTFHLDLVRPEPCLPAGVIVTLNRVSPSHLLPPPMWPRVRIHVTLRYGRGVGFMGGIKTNTMTNIPSQWNRCIPYLVPPKLSTVHHKWFSEHNISGVQFPEQTDHFF